MADIAVTLTTFFVEKIISILLKEGGEQSVPGVVTELQLHLSGIQAYVRECEKNERKDNRRQILEEAREIAYDIEDVLDGFLFHMPHNTHHFTLSRGVYQAGHRLKHWGVDSKFSERAKAVAEKLEKYMRKWSLLAGGNRVFAGESSVSKRENSWVDSSRYVEDNLVGYEMQRDDLLNWLRNGESRLIISVVGPAGSGKSTLVKDVFESRQVQEIFDCHAWLPMISTSVPDVLLRSILKQFHREREEDANFQEQEHIRTRLRTYMQNKRCMVVLDNARRKDQLEKIVNSLDSGGYGRGSRIIITTQNSEVISTVTSRGCVLELKGLSQKDSQMLFRQTVFGRNECPTHLLDLSEKIVTRCDGSPAGITIAGKLLRNQNPNQIEWKDLHDSLGCDIRSSSKSLSPLNGIFMRSYRDLSSAHQSCLLYFSIFPGDYSVSRQRLIRSWVAEGFVDPREVPRHKTPEQIAEDYLNELIGRNLVSVTKREINGRVKSCRLLNLYHGFTVSKSQDNNFVTILAEPNPTTSPGERVRRLSFQCNYSKISPALMDGCLPSVRTAFMFKMEEGKARQLEIERILGKFRFLKVLDLKKAPLQSFPEKIVELKLLRYLSLRQTKIREVPWSVKNLAFLETLDLKKTLVTTLPVDILELPRLCHLLAYSYNVGVNVSTFESRQGVQISTSIAKSSSVFREKLIEGVPVMQKLTLISLKKCKRFVQELHNFIHLRKLGLVYVKSEYGKQLCEAIQEMNNLSTLDLRAKTEDEYLELDHMQKPPPYLQRLYLKGRLHNFPRWISKLQCLLKIGFMWSKSYDNPLYVLESLPNLMEIKMVDCFHGEKLEFRGSTFSNLQKLHLQQLSHLQTVVVEDQTMPLIENINISNCQKLHQYEIKEQYHARLNIQCNDMPRLH